MNHLINSFYLMSIRPKYAEAIFSGKKKYELRRLRGPIISHGSIIIVYSSGDVKSIIGEFTVSRIIRGPPEIVWNKVYVPGTGIGKDAYHFIKGSRTAIAIEVGHRKLYKRPISLDEIRNIIPSWNPPQSYVELKEDDPLYRLIISKLRRGI